MGYFTDMLRGLMHHDHHRDPRKETAEAASHRLRHLERSADAVDRKISRLYGPKPALDPDLVAMLEKGSTRITEQWMHYPPNATLLNTPSVDAELVQAAIYESAQNYFQTFMQRNRLYDDLPDEPTSPYDTLSARDILHSIHANHSTNIAEARLIAAGVNAIDAHRVNGFIIRQCTMFMHNELDQSARLHPKQDRPKTDLEALHQVEKLRSYWRGRVTELRGIMESHSHYDRS